MKTYTVVFTPEAEDSLVSIFEIDDATSQVAIIDVFYGGRDHQRLLGADNDEDEPAGDD